MRAFEEWCLGQTLSLQSRVAELKQSQEARDRRNETLAATIETTSQRVAKLE